MSHVAVIAPEPDFADLLRRARADFLEMPDLVLTYEQAVRLWACHPAVCRAVLETLIESRFLVRTRTSAFVRAA
jgi:SUMO ligase MMS21 Smc5/6 complex component